MLKKLLYIQILLLFGCSSNNANHDHNLTKENIFIIDKDRPFKNSISSPDTNTIVITEYYFDYNVLLIDTLKELYYSTLPFYCLAGREIENNFLPYYVGFDKNSFQKSDDTYALINLISRDSSEDKTVYLVSNTDTIRDERYFEIKDSLKGKGIWVSTITLTEEEEEILRAILTKVDYEPEKVLWDKTIDLPKDFTKK